MRWRAGLRQAARPHALHGCRGRGGPARLQALPWGHQRAEPQQSNGPGFSPSHRGKATKDEVTPLSSIAGAEYIVGIKRSKGSASTWNRVEWEWTDGHVFSKSRSRFVNQDSPGRSQGSWVGSSGELLEEKAFPHMRERERENAIDSLPNGFLVSGKYPFLGSVDEDCRTKVVGVKSCSDSCRCGVSWLHPLQLGRKISHSLGAVYRHFSSGHETRGWLPCNSPPAPCPPEAVGPLEGLAASQQGHAGLPSGQAPPSLHPELVGKGCQGEMTKRSPLQNK